MWPVPVQRAACGHKAQTRCQAEMGGHAARDKQGGSWIARVTLLGCVCALQATISFLYLIQLPGVSVDPLPVAHNTHIESQTYGELQGAAHMWGVNIAQALALP